MVRPAFRAPSSQERAKRSPQNSGAPRREIAKPYPHSLSMISMGYLTCESDVGWSLNTTPRVVPAKAGTHNPWR